MRVAGGRVERWLRRVWRVERRRVGSNTSVVSSRPSMVEENGVLMRLDTCSD